MVCETDFVATNKMFVDFAKNFANYLLLNKKNLEENDFVNLTLDKYISNIDSELKGLTLNECMKYLISKTGENCQIKNLIFEKYNPENEIVGLYLHNTVEETVGKKASFVILKCDEGVKITENQRKKLKELAEQIAMQIIASKPKYLNKEDIPEEVLKKESEMIKEGVYALKSDSTIKSKNDDTDYQNMTEEQINKLVEKKIKNWTDNACLNEQEFVIVDHDAKANHEKVGVIVAKRAKSFGISNLKIKDFKSFY
jgi:elongation factor Ts